jgi:hypothetical protein
MISFRFRLAALFATSTFLLPTPSTAFDSPLSDTAVREAYFLGQHHDEFFTGFMQKYVVALPLPQRGPQIASVSLLTPYAVAAIYSNQQSGSYSAQQAQLDHDKQPEFVRVVVQIWLTESYGPYIVGPTGPRPNSPKGFTPRSPDFGVNFACGSFRRTNCLLP